LHPSDNLPGMGLAPRRRVVASAGSQGGARHGRAPALRVLWRSPDARCWHELRQPPAEAP